MQDAVDEACRTSSVQWSVCLQDVASREVLAAYEPSRVLSTASIGKLLLLVTLASAYESGDVSPDELLSRSLEVADSGLWQHLRVSRLAVDDLAVLVGSVSDNTATNVLLQRVGLSRVRETAAALGLRETGLHDRVRSVRRGFDPPRLSSGSALELAGLCAGLAGGRIVSPAVCATVDRWLSAGADLSMVAGAFGLDPLAHVEVDRGVRLRHKTGTDDGVRGDVGWLVGPSAGLVYAVLANWDAADGELRDEVLASMREIGRALGSYVGLSTCRDGSVDNERG